MSQVQLAYLRPQVIAFVLQVGRAVELDSTPSLVGCKVYGVLLALTLHAASHRDAAWQTIVGRQYVEVPQQRVHVHGLRLYVELSYQVVEGCNVVQRSAGFSLNDGGQDDAQVLYIHLLVLAADVGAQCQRQVRP